MQAFNCSQIRTKTFVNAYNNSSKHSTYMVLKLLGTLENTTEHFGLEIC
jgi:hypothetical protein